MVLIIMIVVTFLLMLMSYYLFNKDIMSPSFLITAGYLLSLVSTLYNINVWDVSIGLHTFLIYEIGIISFVLGENFVKLINSKLSKQTNNDKPLKIGYISIEKWKYFIVFVVCIGILILTYREVVRIANLDFNSWGNIAYNFKTNVINSDLEGASISSLVQQANKITKGFAFVFLYIFVNNVFSVKTIKEKRWNYLNLIPGVMFGVQCVIRGGRFQVVAYIIGAVFLYYFFWRKTKGWNKIIPIKYIIRIVLVILIVILSFWLLREKVGRLSKDNDVMGYVTRYFGGGPALFELYLDDINIIHDDSNETFAGLITSANKLGFNFVARLSHEYRMSGGIIIGNAYSALRNYYHDYGFLGVILIDFILAIIFSKKYYQLKSCSSVTYNKVFDVILYTSFIYAIFFQFFTDYFFARLSIGLFIEILIMRLCYWFITRLRISVGRR